MDQVEQNYELEVTGTKRSGISGELRTITVFDEITQKSTYLETIDEGDRRRADKPADNGDLSQPDNRPAPRTKTVYSLTEPHSIEATTCPDGMSCSGNGMDCVGDGLCKGPEVSGTGLPCARYLIKEIVDGDGQECVVLAKWYYEEIMSALPDAEVSGEVDLQALKREITTQALKLDEKEGCPVGNATQVVFIRGIEFALDAIASRNLLKSEGVCVPDKVIEKVEQYLELILNSPKNPDGTPWINGGMSSVEEIVEKALEALRPFLPAEKE